MRSNVESLTLTGTGDLRGTGNEMANTITGNNGNNVLSGGAGADTLIGGTGADILVGGAGQDEFFYFSTTDNTVVVSGSDTIRDFVSGEDQIFFGFDFDTRTSDTFESYTFIGTEAFSGSSPPGSVGEVRTQQSGRNTTVEGDTNGGGAADFAVLLTSVTATSPTDQDFGTLFG